MQAVNPAAVGHVVEDGHGQGTRFLGDQANGPAQFQQFPIAGLDDILPAEQDAAGDLQSLYIIMQAVQAFEQGALSAAGGTYDTGNLVSGEGKRHIFQDMRSADVYVQVMDS